jgi:DNA-binding CsgD family transcriptional regulator
MSELTSQDFQLVSRCIAKLNLPCLLADFPNRALHLLQQLVGSERVLCQSFDRECVTLLATDLTSVDIQKTPEKIPLQYLCEEPLIGNLFKNNRWDAFKISDRLTSEELRRDEQMYETFYGTTNIDDGISISIHDTPQQPDIRKLSFRGMYSNTLKNSFVDGDFHPVRETSDNLFFALGRTKQNFTERDREILNLFRPHLLIAYHNVLYYTQLQQQLTQLTQVTEQFGTILLSADGYIQQISNRAAEIMQLYFAGESISGSQLPDILTSWVKQQIKEFKDAQPSQLLKPLRIKAANKYLSIRLLKDPLQEQWILTFDESENPQLSIDFFCSIGLTQRESEVMFWVVQGLSNAQIALQLACGMTTVKKHLENIYSKLNVQSRSMAVAISLKKYLQSNRLNP